VAYCSHYKPQRIFVMQTSTAGARGNNFTGFVYTDIATYLRARRRASESASVMPFLMASCSVATCRSSVGVGHSWTIISMNSQHCLDAHNSPHDIPSWMHRVTTKCLTGCGQIAYSWTLQRQILWCSTTRRQNHLPSAAVRVGENHVLPSTTVHNLFVSSSVCRV